MITIWNDFLYQPLFNALIWIYNNWADGNLGWAVVYLTIILRVVLLPFSLVNEYNRIKNEELYREIQELDKVYQNDQVIRKQEIRKVLKKRRVQPWAKVTVLGIQALVLVLLYQVFLRGITGEKILKILYSTVDFPGVINTNFYGFDLGMRHDFIWAGVVALFIFVGIYLKLRRLRGRVQRTDLTYFVLFPLAVFTVLWILPMVKALFILTSLIFSVIVGRIANLFFQEAIKRKIVKIPKE
jgi:YidC/Oxa1 family membrane protein insertase